MVYERVADAEEAKKRCFQLSVVSDQPTAVISIRSTECFHCAPTEANYLQGTVDRDQGSVIVSQVPKCEAPGAPAYRTILEEKGRQRFQPSSLGRDAVSG